MDKKQVLILGCMTAFFWGGIYTFSPTLSTYAESLGANSAMIGLIGGSYGLMQLIFRIPIGILSDRTNKRRPLLILGMSIVALTGVSFLFSSTPEGLLFSRSLSGIAASFLSIITVMLSSYFANTTKGVGIVNACMFSGLMAASVAGGWASQNLGPDIPFIMTIVLGTVGLILTLFVKEKKIDKAPISVRELLKIGKEKPVLFYSVLGIVLQIVSYGTSYVFTPMVAQKLGASDTELGVLTFIYTLPGIVASLIIGTLFFRNLGYKKVLGVSFILMGASCIPIALTESLLVVYLGQLVSGFGRGISFALLLSFVVSSVTSDKKTTATSLYQAIYALGMFVGPVFTGLFSKNSSFIVPYTIICVICVVAAIGSFIYSPKTGAEGQQNANNW